MAIIKNVRMCPANGGYIIKYDEYGKGMDQYESERFIGEKKIVVDDGNEAIATLDKLFMMSSEYAGLDMEVEMDDDYEEEGGSTNLMKQG